MGALVTKPVVPVEEEPEEASGRLSLTISCSVKSTVEEEARGRVEEKGKACFW
jgi:hypothetical protein